MQLGVSFLIFYKESIALLFHHFLWYWFKVGRQFVVMALDKQAAISFNKYCPYACCLRTLFVDVSTARLFPKEAAASKPHLKCLLLKVYH